ncbi:hypothetical protein N9045_00480 [bacterium]|nr:hypothetical protein [bacterium]
MSSSILPNGLCSTLPFAPTDGQIFIDAQRVQWIYSSDSGVWERRGTADDIPLASAIESGLMSPQQKNMLDKVPAVGGGFGIITDAKTILSGPSNPAGVISGDINLKSESLDINCIGYNGQNLDPGCIPPTGDIVCTPGGTANDVGLKFTLSEKFLKTLFVDAGGEQGRTGYQGEKGEDGENGWVPNGPVGNTGLPGESIDQLCELEDISYRDIPGYTDTAIVRMTLLNDTTGGCKLVLYKAKIQSENEQLANKLKATQVSRTISYPDSGNKCDIDSLLNYEIQKAGGDTSPLDLQLLRLPKQITEEVNFNGSLSLSGLLDSVADVYRNKLKKADKDWGKQVKKYIEGLDSSARTILSNLANEVAQCEFNLPAVEYCITFENCDAPPPVSPPFRVAGGAQAVHEDSPFNGQSANTFGAGRRNWNLKL